MQAWHDMAAVRPRGWLLTALLALAAAAQAAPERAPARWFFDDFGYASVEALEQQGGWQRRSAAGHPGVPGARWAPEGVSLLNDPDRPGRGLLRLRAQTDGTPAGTQQVQLCHQRKLLRGTYAARVRFSDEPVGGVDGDPVVQTFYAVAPLRHDFDPEFSELDWEYLPNGGWGSEKTRLYGISWHTVRLDPWLAFNQSHEEFGSMGGWHVLVTQVETARVRWWLDGRLLAEHGGRNVPAVPMAISFNQWFSPAGLLPAGGAPRVYEQDVDWVAHVQDRILSPQQMLDQVNRFRRQGVARLDQVPPADPPLQSRCDF